MPSVTTVPVVHGRDEADIVRVVGESLSRHGEVQELLPGLAARPGGLVGTAAGRASDGRQARQPLHRVPLALRILPVGRRHQSVVRLARGCGQGQVFPDAENEGGERMCMVISGGSPQGRILPSLCPIYQLEFYWRRWWVEDGYLF